MFFIVYRVVVVATTKKVLNMLKNVWDFEKLQSFNLDQTQKESPWTTRVHLEKYLYGKLWCWNWKSWSKKCVVNQTTWNDVSWSSCFGNINSKAIINIDTTIHDKKLLEFLFGLRIPRAIDRASFMNVFDCEEAVVKCNIFSLRQLSCCKSKCRYFETLNSQTLYCYMSRSNFSKYAYNQKILISLLTNI